jgi:hypothetical protein
MAISPRDVETRADGRPPEEAESENPKEQAKAILEDSEHRLESGAERSEGEGTSVRRAQPMGKHPKSG